MRVWVSNIYYSFPFQLLILHLRSNLMLISIWGLIFLSMTGKLGRKLGFQYLFLDPEYLGAVGFWSFFFIGLAFGGFVMSWNLTVYLLSSHHFPFLASLSRPFSKFCFNNLLLPLFFFLCYLGLIIFFQRYYQNMPALSVLVDCIGLFSGGLFLILFYAIYFHFTNRDISYYQKREKNAPNLEKTYAPGRRGVDVDYIKMDHTRWKVKIYLNESFQPRLVRSVAHYEAQLLMNIFKQNHLNALVIQLISMLLLLVLGYSIDYASFRIPTGASLLILMSIAVAIIGAVSYWFNEWRVTIIIILLIGVNYFTSFNLFNYRNKAYGLDYQTTASPYSYEELQKHCLSDQVEKDKKNTISILNNWQKKVHQKKQPLPKMVILCASGGGFKATSWATHVVQAADSILDGRLFDNTVLITGASGGMMGLAYLREIYLQKQLGNDVNLYDRQHIDDITKDLLNSIAFTFISNDMFLPWATFQVDGYSYHKDRGYIYEKELNKNTHGLMDKTLIDYKEVESSGLIPMLYLTPSIVNDARRLVISPQGVSFMMVPPVGIANPEAVEIDAVDFGLIFKDQNASNLRFLTGVRMNSTYPYVLPNVHLPSKPQIEVMDAGFIDNYGILSATRFIQVFKDWILENTSGVVLIQLSSSAKIAQISASDKKGAIVSMLNPLGIAGKVLTLQEFEHDTSLGFIYDLLGKDHFNVIRFHHHSDGNNKLEASISFHITEREKENVFKALQLEDNQKSLENLVKLLSTED